MKKHQKVLLGIMALSLAGGTGTAVALKFTGASSSQTVPTDDAIYLYWGDTDQNKAVDVQVTDFVSGVSQYRPLVVAPKSTARIANGTVTISFKLEAKNPEEEANNAANYTLAGLTVKVYEVGGFEFTNNPNAKESEYSYTYLDSYSKIDEGGAEGTPKKNLVATLTGGVTESTGTATFGVGASDTPYSTSERLFAWNHYYTMVFTWDGTPSTGYTFGGILNITQSFKVNV